MKKKKNLKIHFFISLLNKKIEIERKLVSRRTITFQKVFVPMHLGNEFIRDSSHFHGLV